MSRISVIVPVYNVEDYLDWCLSSLEKQTFADIEVICVNDGSTDGSRDKLAQWANRDKRILIIDKPNGGLSSARNAGIDSATSDYVCFLDSDDRFHLDACETMLELLDESGADVLTFGADCYPKDAGYPWLNDVLSPRDVTYSGFSPDILFKESSRPFAWRTACRRDFLLEHGIRFVDGFGEDQIFDFAIYPRSKKTVLSSAKLYDYRVVREGSLMDKWRGRLDEKMLEHTRIYGCILDDWSEGGFLEQYVPEILSFAADFILNDALKLGRVEFSRVAKALKATLSRYWKRDAIESLGLPSVINKMIDSCYRGSTSAAMRKVLVMEYYAYRNGRRAALRHVISELRP